VSARITVAVVDDQQLVREGLATMLRLMPEVEVVGTASDGDEALALLRERDPEIVLMDLRMPRCDGVEATRRVHAEHPGTQVIVLTTYADDESIFGALRAGARGYLTKDTDPAELLRAIQVVRAGHALMDPLVQSRVLHRIARRPQRAPSSLPDGLTVREAEILTLVAGGLTNQQIQDRLAISEATVKTHISSVFAKVGVRDRAQAVRYAYRHGLANPDDTPD
jgi:DNA-binding NarL/FixJ family response regulator